MMHTTRRHAAAIALVGIVAAVALEPGAVASTPHPASAPNSASVSTAPRASRLAVLVTTRTVIPKIQRTVRFTGYATYTFPAPKGRRIVSASARIVGAQAHAVSIRRRTISRNLKRYTVSLVFPGEQGNPGKLVIRLGTVS
jgi:hypothetical protein